MPARFDSTLRWVPFGQGQNKPWTPKANKKTRRVARWAASRRVFAMKRYLI